VELERPATRLGWGFEERPRRRDRARVEVETHEASWRASPASPQPERRREEGPWTARRIHDVHARVSEPASDAEVLLERDVGLPKHMAGDLGGRVDDAASPPPVAPRADDPIPGVSGQGHGSLDGGQWRRHVHGV
jgi:hypothetical protein